MNHLAPIVLFVYNRPNHTKKTVEGLLTNKEASESILYIFSDGPKVGATPEDLSLISEVREFIHTISGFKKIIIEEQETNKSLAVSTIEGMGKVFSQHDKAIMLEDDDVPTPFFLQYMNECLTRFFDDEKIWYVSGYIDTERVPPEGQDDLFLVTRPSSWGFGTWKRCWDKVIWDKAVLKGLFRHPDVICGYNKRCGMDSSDGMIKCIKGITSSWSIRYNFAGYLTKSYTILPSKSLIYNIGLDGTGTHSPVLKQDLKVFDRPVTIPAHIQFDRKRNKELLMTFISKKIIVRLLYNMGLLSVAYLLSGKYKL